MTIDARAGDLPPAPMVARRDHVVRAPFGAERHDPYYWLRDDRREDAEVLGHLRAENAYADAVMAPLRPLEDRLYAEIVGRIKQDDRSVPYRRRGYWYYSRYETGKDYPIHARRKGDLAAPEEVLLDVEALAAGKDYYQVGNYQVTQDGMLLAWANDTAGRRQYTIRFRDLATGTTLGDAICGTSGAMVWADDGRTLYYIENDPQTLLGRWVKRHVLGTATANDPVVYEETDDAFHLSLYRSRDDRFLCIAIESTVVSELRFTAAAAPADFRVLAARERDVEYSADHHAGRWVIRTNAPASDGTPARNFRIAVAPTATGDRGLWRDWIGHRDDVFIESFELFDRFVAIGERSEGLARVRLIQGTPGEMPEREAHVAADEPAYAMHLATNAEPDTDWLRYRYTSLTTPGTTYEVDVRSGKRRLLKRDPVLGGYDPADYTTERLWAPARDGTRIPVSIVYRNGLPRDGTAALLQYGYGSYGAAMDPAFSVTTVSLLDRGLVYALAHVRGGQELGRAWYDDGRLLRKKNTFTDFIDVTDHLVRLGYAAPDRVAAYGGSAGGLLMGAIANLAPERYHVILSQVPFVDVVTTMLDPGIPLTTNEYDEWGNPAERSYYDYMLSYSPYDNIGPKPYPAMFIGTGLWDSQVQYWEPAKYVARLRDHTTGSRPIVFRVNLDAGHGGKSGRFRRYRETAEMYAFLLDQLGVSGGEDPAAPVP
jgi:oligopeptidase B